MQNTKAVADNNMNATLSFGLLILSLGIPVCRLPIQFSWPPVVGAFCFVDVLFVSGTFVNSRLFLAVIEGF